MNKDSLHHNNSDAAKSCTRNVHLWDTTKKGIFFDAVNEVIYNYYYVDRSMLEIYTFTVYMKCSSEIVPLGNKSRILLAKQMPARFKKQYRQWILQPLSSREHCLILNCP